MVTFGICSKSKYKIAETDQIRPNQIKGRLETNTNNPNPMRTSDQIIFVYVLVYCSPLSRRAQQSRGLLLPNYIKLAICYFVEIPALFCLCGGRARRVRAHIVYLPNPSTPTVPHRTPVGARLLCAKRLHLSFTSPGGDDR